MASLAEILALKKAQASAQGAFRQEELLEIEVPYQSEPVDRVLFIAVYSILIQHPYEVDLQSFRELRNFLLGDAQYVLNTFPRMPEDWLFRLMLRSNPPRQAMDLHRLWLAINEILLCVPADYELSILAQIASPRKIFFLQNF